ncbi:hypothetical protein [Candidatus Hydrogenosomobacter endosymbioticus]|uniref:Uncharacterized protein n=1 Tax=Candidatus Hydrogenosomobacter endosymbioticus TaxID=2558174 RepID=A0ABM7V8W3_9PROT|nr:hypothetical protein [Candidatus Hydrogenosomobacter endosymbioticus]BDB96213.1 hypothetical protein HYD_3460 [Candidatus Hydrogenosomobacter endosymbioticus]
MNKFTFLLVFLSLGATEAFSLSGTFGTAKRFDFPIKEEKEINLDRKGNAASARLYQDAKNRQQKKLKEEFDKELKGEYEIEMSPVSVAIKNGLGYNDALKQALGERGRNRRLYLEDYLTQNLDNYNNHNFRYTEEFYKNATDWYSIISKIKGPITNVQKQLFDFIIPVLAANESESILRLAIDKEIDATRNLIDIAQSWYKNVRGKRLSLLSQEQRQILEFVYGIVGGKQNSADLINRTPEEILLAKARREEIPEETDYEGDD